MLRNAGNLIGGEFKGRAYHTPAEGRNGSGEADVLHVGGVEENEETLFAVGEIFDVVRVGARGADALESQRIHCGMFQRGPGILPCDDSRTDRC